MGSAVPRTPASGLLPDPGQTHRAKIRAIQLSETKSRPGVGEEGDKKKEEFPYMNYCRLRDEPPSQCPAFRAGGSSWDPSSPPNGRTQQPSLREMQAHVSLWKMNPFSRSIPSAEVNLLAGEGGAPLF